MRQDEVEGRDLPGGNGEIHLSWGHITLVMPVRLQMEMFG